MKTLRTLLVVLSLFLSVAGIAHAGENAHGTTVVVSSISLWLLAVSGFAFFRQVRSGRKPDGGAEANSNR